MLRPTCVQLFLKPGLAASATLLRGFAKIIADTDIEKQVAEKIRAGLQNPTKVHVQDTSGGCGAMYRIEVVADDFKALSTLKQHQLVHKLIVDEVKQWHGYTLDTKSG